MTCFVKFAEPMCDKDFEDKAEAICNLRDILASMRWDFMEQQPILGGYARTAYLREEMWKVIDEYPPLDWEYESSCIYRPYPSPEEVFSHL